MEALQPEIENYENSIGTTPPPLPQVHSESNTSLSQLSQISASVVQSLSLDSLFKSTHYRKLAALPKHVKIGGAVAAVVTLCLSIYLLASLMSGSNDVVIDDPVEPVVEVASVPDDTPTIVTPVVNDDLPDFIPKTLAQNTQPLEIAPDVIAAFGKVQVGALDASVIVNVSDAGSTLTAWIDFNRDGSIGGPGEKVFSDVDLKSGDNLLYFDIPSWALSGNANIQFQFSSNSTTETTSHVVEIQPPTPTSGQFVEQKPISTNAIGAQSVFTVDVDGDGDLDILSASMNDDKIAWYENDGKQNFTEQIISTSANGAYSVFAADVDSDGDLDILSASLGDDKIAWYENDGQQNFTEIIISTSADMAISVFAADVDGDGDLDILSSSLRDNKIAWYKNDGRQNFTEQIISTSADGARSVFAADMDGDGDLDVLSGSHNDDKIPWYENDGKQNFNEKIISTSAKGAIRVLAADMDGDGDLDVLSTLNGDARIAWYENDGQQKFTEQIISTSANGPSSVFAVDVDSDGDLDVLCASGGDNKIAWYRNNGKQNFTEQIISTSARRAYSVFAADMDNDGDLDILSASQGDDKITWYKNINDPSIGNTTPPDNSPPVSTVQSIKLETIQNSVGMKLVKLPAGEFLMGSPRTEADRNANELQHKVTLSQSFYMGSTEVTQGQWKAVMGTTPWKGQNSVKEDTQLAVSHINWNDATEFCRKLSDKEGKIYRLPTEAEWEYACRAGSSTMYHFGVDATEIAKYAWHGGSLVHPVGLKRPNSFGLYDMHGNVWEWCADWYEDDYYTNSPAVDPVGPTSGTKRVLRGGSWNEQTRRSRSALRFGNSPAIGAFPFGFRVVCTGDKNFAEQIISTSADNALSVFAADVDGDGDLDILSASMNDDKIVWYENDGKENFTEKIISTSATRADSVITADVDGDGDLDILSASKSDNKIAWYENDGKQKFTEQIISSKAYHAQSVFAADVDGDGDLDVLSASGSDNKIAWYKNDGKQIFTEKIISTMGNDAFSVFAADMDGDGDLDILSSHNDKIALYENDGKQIFTEKIISTSTNGAFSVIAADIDGDGDLDVLSSSARDDKIAWYENDGKQNFTEQIISTSADGAQSVFAADVDSDGDLDILSASVDDNKIAWYKNTKITNTGNTAPAASSPPVSSVQPPQAETRNIPDFGTMQNTLGMNLMKLPAGDFMMGSPRSEKGREDSEQQHRVRLSQGFYLATTEVTQGQWQSLMGTTPWSGRRRRSNLPEQPSGADHAVSHISWEDASHYCHLLSLKEGRKYRLPTEAEFEYACRAGTTTPYSFGSDPTAFREYAWLYENAEAQGEAYAHIVAQKRANAWGLYDMHGNMQEWCSDWYRDDYEDSPNVDPFGPPTGKYRVLKGGSYHSSTNSCRSAYHDQNLQSSSDIGFRVVCELELPSATPPIPPVQPATVSKRKTFQNSIGMKLVKIPAGEFLMGSQISEKDRSEDEQQHRVRLSQDFYLATTAVTQQQWQLVMGSTPRIIEPHDRVGAECPLTRVSWEYAVKYCNKLSEREGLVYRLPTEAEWEYACRASTTTAYSFGNDATLLKYHAWFIKENPDFYYSNNPEDRVLKVGQKLANAWGLYDMHGTVGEWCSDLYAKDYYSNSPSVDPSGPLSSPYHVVRGGSWEAEARDCRSASRFRDTPLSHRSTYGFRVVCESDPSITTSPTTSPPSSSNPPGTTPSVRKPTRSIPSGAPTSANSLFKPATPPPALTDPKVEVMVQLSVDFLNSSKSSSLLGEKCVVALALYKAGEHVSNAKIQDAITTVKESLPLILKSNSSTPDESRHAMTYDVAHALILFCEVNPVGNANVIRRFLSSLRE
ncbi:MAG: SUMF1/EgtB/PvdO family nonheme iron enzyme [Pirellulales bacterium]